MFYGIIDEAGGKFCSFLLIDPDGKVIVAAVRPADDFGDAAAEPLDDLRLEVAARVGADELGDGVLPVGQPGRGGDADRVAFLQGLVEAAGGPGVEVHHPVGDVGEEPNGLGHLLEDREVQVTQGPLGLLPAGGLPAGLGANGHQVDPGGPSAHALLGLLDALGEALLHLREIGPDAAGVDVEHLPQVGGPGARPAETPGRHRGSPLPRALLG